MEVFNRTPAIAEDTLHYTLYPPTNLSDRSSVTTFAACISTYVDSLLPGFIWHRDAFELKVVPNPDSDKNETWLLEGRMRVGDCVDDEWCVIWVLREISAKWDMVIGAFDSDGEFLLIEAAEALPSWVKPTNSENRVWIYSSRLHLIPISHVSSPSRRHHRRKLPGTSEDDSWADPNTVDEDSDEFISTEDATRLVRDTSFDTTAPPGVERTVWERISGYPAAARNHIHVAKAYIPADIARVLVKNPLLVQKAVETFYTRDAIQLRAAHRMSRFPPDSCVLSAVKMTRTAYAQLVGQKFFPPKVFGTWKDNQDTKVWRWHDVGMKIAVGFEILYQESKGKTSMPATSADVIDSSAEAKKDALRRNPEYTKYIQNLVSADYFKGEMESSALWKTYESRAADIFIETRREDDAQRQSFAAQVNTAVSENPSLPLSSELEEDADDWLNIDAQDFENLLQKSIPTPGSKEDPDKMDVDSPGASESYEDRLASKQASKLKELAAKVEDFVEGEGDLEGARFDDEEFSDEPFSDEESSQESEDEEGRETTAARQAAMDKLVPGLEPSEYGQMPASFHSNSQRTAPTSNESDVVEEGKSQEQPTTTAAQAPPRTKPVRLPIIPRDRYDGVDSDDETDEEDPVDDESDEDKPQVVGDIEIDMGEEEEEFLEFSRQALGITDQQWHEIIQDRQGRGAFIPASANTPKKDVPKNIAEKPPSGRTPQSGPRPNVNPNLDSFEAVMQAMDAELARFRPSSRKAAPPSHPPNDKGKGKATVIEEEEDIEAAMDAELKAALEAGGIEDEDEDGEAPADYNLIKNFLESFKSQAGLSGPVSNLAGRLQPGRTLPRDGS